ncbi:hypothetical protein CRE_16609 [Caenorhabditis remanei]|uniref:Kinase n=1 Tax=Caenorhabditis remanei TaxID=31234 RepID=E3MAP7_CAERE|nr:hypothetical protein CRE_16609 [Caenorhabditis remanei]
MAYEKVAGRAEIISVHEGHLLKTTTKEEVDSYLRMSESLANVAPRCCYIITNGKLVEMKKCIVCIQNSSKISQLMTSHSNGEFLILKDEGYEMVNPRIMDLKLGTRTHSDYITKEKKENHIRKCKATTSEKLGLRLSGAAFVGSGDSFATKWDKAFGKSLKSDQFFKAMKNFFDVDERQKTEVLRQLLKIRVVLEDSTSHRFFGSSLLILIDDEGQETVKVKLIDFASMARSETGQQQYDGVDTGAILGVNTLIKFLTK